MKIKRDKTLGLFRPSDLFLPFAFFAASLLGRGTAAFGLFIALYATKLCALATSDGLRATFATQPSMKYVQGSALISLICQLPGAVLAALILYLIPDTRSLVPLVPCGMLLNIEHVFYEYLCAVGDKNSAMAGRCITAVLTLLGLLLCMPPRHDIVRLIAVEPFWPLVTAGLSALIGLFIGFSLGGRFHPVLNTEVLRRAPTSMLQAALCPALILVTLTLLWPAGFIPTPFFAGLALYEACRTPFRRSPLESRTMNRMLSIIAIAFLICFAIFHFLVSTPLSMPIAMTCAALVVAAICAFAMFGCVEHRD